MTSKSKLLASDSDDNGQSTVGIKKRRSSLLQLQASVPSIRGPGSNNGSNKPSVSLVPHPPLGNNTAAMRPPSRSSVVAKQRSFDQQS